MNRTVATAILGLTVMFAASATAAEKFADGAKVKIAKFNTRNQEAVPFIMKKQGEDKNGDGIYYLQQDDGDGTYLYASSTKVGTAVNYSKSPTKWILHKNSGGWSIMHAEDGANTVSLNKDGERELQRNQGAKNQVWQIEEQGSR